MQRPLTRYFIFAGIFLVSFIGLQLHQSQTVQPKIPDVIPAKMVVVASRKEDDTAWLGRRLPDWPVTRYIVDTDNKSTEFTVPVNKGRESMVYLTYLIDHYDKLPDTIVFIHSLQYQWHNDDPNHDGATVLSRLQLPYIQTEGYVNLRCVWVLGCPAEIHPNSVTDKSASSEVIFRDAYLRLLPAGGNQTVVPDVVGVSCCGQFAVSRNKVLEKPRSEYERLRQWLIDTPLEDSLSGRVFEYSWHIIFGRSSVHCPSAQSCYCNVYGLCDLTGCTENSCEGRYTLPSFSNMPEDWKQLPEFDT